MLNLESSDLAELRRILKCHVPDRRAVAFGSRAAGTARRYSDLDLVLLGEGRVAPAALNELRAALAESDLPIRVDVLDWNDLPAAFQQTIDRSPRQVVQEPDAPPAK